MNWPSVPFPGCLVPHGVGRANQILASDIRAVGRFPVVDQGQGQIAGFTDDEERVVKSDLPFIVFGDHTRVFKYVDFPFVLGADGTKVLKPNAELFDARFFYFAALGLDIPSRGYNRHFSLLKERSIPRPDLPEQRQIATVLSAVQRAIERQERLIALAAELKKALMHKLFTEGTRGDSQHHPDLGRYPENWSLTPIAEVGRCVTGTTPSTKVPEYWSSADHEFISPADLGESKYVKCAGRHISAAGLGAARPLPRDSVLCVCIGSSIGKTGLTWHAVSSTNQQINSVVVDAAYNPHFVYYLLSHWSENWRRHATFGPVPMLSKGAFEKVSVPWTCDRPEQDRIAEILSSVDAKLEAHRRLRQAAVELFSTLLHQLITGQLRVHDLDLSALGAATQEPAGAA